MAITLIASYQLKSAVQGTTALVTPSFTPSNGEVITITMESFDTTITMTATNSGSQTVKTPVTEQPGGFNGFARISTIEVSGSPGSMTVTGTPSASARYSMTVERWGGAQLAATPVTNANTSTTGAAQSTITPTAGTSIIAWVGQDSQSVDPTTRTYAGSGTDDGTRDDHVGSNGVGYHGYQNSTGTGSQTYGLSTPTGQKWVICAVEVQAQASANPGFDPSQQVRRRLPSAPRMPRSARISTPVRAQVNPPFPFIGVKQPRRLRDLLPRRGEVFLPVPAQIVITAPKLPPQAVRTRLRGLRLFRGHAATPVPAQVVAPPAYPPQSIRARIRGVRWFRGHSAGPMSDQAVISPTARGRVKGFKTRSHLAGPPIDQASAGQTQRPRLRLPRPFRGRATQPTSTQVVVVPPAFPPPSVRTRLRGLRLFRPHAAAPVPGQVVVIPPAYPQQSVRTRVKGLRLFRGRASAPIPGQIVIVAPTLVLQAIRARIKALRPSRGRPVAPPVDQTVSATTPHARPREVAPRRGHIAMPPPPQAAVPPPAYPPASVRPRLKGLRSLRGRQAASPVPAQIIVAPPAYPPALTRAKKRVARILRGVARFVPFTDTTPVVQPRTPTVTVDLARATAVADETRPVAIADTTRSATVADLSRAIDIADLSRPNVTVNL